MRVLPQAARPGDQTPLSVKSDLAAAKTTALLHQPEASPEASHSSPAEPSAARSKLSESVLLGSSYGEECGRLHFDGETALGDASADFGLRLSDGASVVQVLTDDMWQF